MTAIQPFLSGLPTELVVLGLICFGLSRVFIFIVALLAVLLSEPGRRGDTAMNVLQLLLTRGRQPIAGNGSRTRRASTSRRRRRRPPSSNP
ncbi:hypothetical protein OHB54_46895 (plasmid) [Streptomyces sp. NBC_01007]|nr:hypothetical protein OHB54_46895 [Streptomyces sp. NBC_01007]